MFLQYIKNIRPKLLYSGTKYKEEIMPIVEPFFILPNEKDNTTTERKP